MDNKIKILLFDIDGTLLDFQASEEAGLKAVLAQYGEERLPQMMQAYVRINRGLWDAYETGRITKKQITDTRFAALFSEFGIEADGLETEHRYREQLNRSAILVDGALEILEYLKDRYELYVVTNGFTETQTMRMADSGLDRYFIKSFISEEVGYQKPQKEYFDHVLSHIGQAEKDEIMIIGDSMQSDMKGGYLAGIQTCWYHPQTVEAAEQKEAAEQTEILVTKQIGALKELMEFLCNESR